MLFLLIWFIGNLNRSQAASPSIAVRVLDPQTAELSWTNTPGGFALEETDALSTTNLWEPYSPGPTLQNNQFIVTVNIEPSTNRFFRLRQTSIGGLPPDPGTVAPPLDTTVATDFSAATAFLYASGNPIQTGVTNGTIESRRAAVIRGTVRTRDGATLSDVRISVLGRSEFGQTLSRADGLFDLAVNGGGQLTVRYEKDGFLAAQRAIVTPWRDYVWLPDVVMIPFDTAVTAVDLNLAAMQVARGSATSDADGSRRATILFPQGTGASLVMANGTTQSVSSLNIRATEYTVGTNGPAAMPTNLPPSRGYTYCAELSADEAVAAGATDVRFSQPLPVYVENFLDFPVGSEVPTGYYDRQKGQWIASANGRVIKVLSITSGMADLDTDGDDTADDATKLAALGVTSDERARLAQLFTPGQMLWRVPITHFTPWDFNWPFGPPPDAVAPKLPKVRPPVPDDPDEECGSIIGIQNQTLGESLPVTGTPFTLHYQSERTPGRNHAYTLEIPLSGATIPASLKRIELQISVAGRPFAQNFPASPRQTYTFIWDGKDAYGRRLQGAQPVTVKIGYVYGGVYLQPSERPGNGYDALFGHFSYYGAPISGNRERVEVTLWQQYDDTLVGRWDNRSTGLGGWSLSVQHAYDPVARTLLLGDGRQRRAESLSLIITTVAGHGSLGFDGDGGPAVEASMSTLFGVAVGPDGSLYVADYENNRVRRVGSDHVITTVAGNGNADFSGDGGPAVVAGLNAPSAVAVGSDGNLFIADSANRRVRRVRPDGIITTLAGRGIFGGSNGDGGPAVAAGLGFLNGVAVGLDGSLFIAESENRIRRVGTDGIITTIAGNGFEGFGGDGGPATASVFYNLGGIAVGSDGSLFVADSGNNRVRRVGPDGIITTVAGNGIFGFSGDGGPAVAASLNYPIGVALGSDGSLFIANYFNSRIRRVGSDGIINTIAGNGTDGFSGDGGEATAAALSNPFGIAVGPDSSLFITDRGNRRIRQVGPVSPTLFDSDFLLSSEDGGEIYIFNSSGQHRTTLDALTGSMRYQFGYAADGYLTSITDKNGNVTIIERSGAAPTARIAPGGQRTALSVSSDGWLLGVTNPAGESHTMSYSTDGLLQQFINPLGNISSFTYDAQGRLIKDEDAVGGSTTLTRTEQSNGYTVTTASALGRSRAYQVEQLSIGAIRRTVTQASGAKTVRMLNTDGSEQITHADGSIITIKYGPDPRWGMLAPVASSVKLKTPGGLTRTVTTTRTAALADPSNLFSLTKLTDSITDNGAVSTSVYDATSRLLTTTTAAGRTAVFNLDAQGRLTQEQVAGLDPLTYAYDSRGFFQTITQGNGPDVRTNRFDYNPAGYVTNITDPLDYSLIFAYDAVGRVTTQTSHDGRMVNLAHDANGNLTSLTPSGKPAHTFEYSAVDLKTRYFPPAVVPGTNFTLYTYNLDKELIAVKQPDQEVVQYDYSASDCNCGRLGSLIQARGTNSYSYDALTGKLTGIQAPGGINLIFTYDGGLLLTETRSGAVPGIVSNTYDNNFRVTSQSVSGGAPIALQYDTDGLLVQAGALTLIRNDTNGMIARVTLGGITNSWAYNGFAEITNSSAAFNATTLYAVAFTRDQAGRVIQKTEMIDGVSDQYVYTYDPGDRLAAVLKNGATVATY
ncbi:MAG: hypothetical protein DME23_02000, partial [Verrucomicrobia bacterium]